MMHHLSRAQKTKQGGYFLLLILVFSAVFLTILTSLTGFIFVQQRVQLAKENREKAIQIAEAGLDYYKWFLAHFPNDLQNGTGQPGPYEHTYNDPEGGATGTFSLEIEGNTQCDVVSSIDITSTGASNADPTFKRTVFGRYARPSVAEFAYIINSNVWAGDDRIIIGPYHTNGGVRMDGDNRSTVASGVATWLCTSSFGCSPSSNQNGVFGIGTQPSLWTFPSAPIDFVGITTDLAQMRAQAIASGLYFAPVAEGYRVVFRNDDTADVYRVDDTDWVWGYSTQQGWHANYHIIAAETFLGNFAIPGTCQLLFVEDDLWIEGEVSGKVTIAAADVTTPNVGASIVLNDNITYTATDGSVGLTALAEDDVLVPLLSPDVMSLSGIFIAQNGHFGRNYYTTAGSRDVPSQYDDYVQQSQLTMVGTIVSNGRVGTKWTCGGVYCSGYNNRINAYDRNLATEPPPLTPHVSDDYRFTLWREE